MARVLAFFGEVPHNCPSHGEGLIFCLHPEELVKGSGQDTVSTLQKTGLANYSEKAAFCNFSPPRRVLGAKNLVSDLRPADGEEETCRVKTHLVEIRT